MDSFFLQQLSEMKVDSEYGVQYVNGKITKNKLISESENGDLVFHYCQPSGAKATQHRNGNKWAEPVEVIRLKNPTANKKYHIFPGSETFPYLTKGIIGKYQNKEKIPVLILTEGQKKAIRLDVEGVTAIGLNGIHQFGGNDEHRSMFHEFILEIIKACNVEVLVFLLDADSMITNFQPNHSEKDLFTRANSFASAVINFRQASENLIRKGWIIDAYFLNILPGYAEKGKGIDDLLNTYSFQTREILADLFELNFCRKYFSGQSVTKLNDYTIREIFGADNAVNYYRKYEKAIAEKEFTYRKKKYQFDKEEGTLVELDTTNKSVDYAALAAESLVQQTEVLPEPEVTLEFFSEHGNAIIATQGNISAISGKAKGRKTYFVSMLIAAFLSFDWLQKKIRRGLVNKKCSVTILFDTEQSRYHTQKVQHRILKLLGKENHQDLIVYNLRRYEPTTRLKIIEYVIASTSNLGLIAIDGVRDIGFDINDSKEAITVVGNLMKLSETYNIHILCVLHENKGDNNLRGHFGTELVNKSETVISVNKLPDQKEYSVVRCEYSRNRDFEEFSFGINEEGLPIINQEGVTEKKEKSTVRKAFHPSYVEEIKHLRNISNIFTSFPRPQYGNLWRSAKDIYEVGDNAAKDIINFWIAKKWIEVSGTEGTKKSFYVMGNWFKDSIPETSLNRPV